MDGPLAAPPGIRWVTTLAFVGLIVALSVAPAVARTRSSVVVWLVVHTATSVQKALHVAAYAVLAILWVWTLEPIEPHVLKTALAFSASVGLGAALEWHQVRVPGRHGTMLDVVLNAVGAAVGLALAVVIL